MTRVGGRKFRVWGIAGGSCCSDLRTKTLRPVRRIALIPPRPVPSPPSPDLLIQTKLFGSFCSFGGSPSERPRGGPTSLVSPSHSPPPPALLCKAPDTAALGCSPAAPTPSAILETMSPLLSSEGVQSIHVPPMFSTLCFLPTAPLRQTVLALLGSCPNLPRPPPPLQPPPYVQSAIYSCPACPWPLAPVFSILFLPLPTLPTPVSSRCLVAPCPSLLSFII